MATYFVASGGSNTAPYDTWAKAATSLATALAAATSTGDVVVIQYNAVPSTDAEVAADATYTFAGAITLMSASNDGGSAYTATAMGTANWIGNSTTNRSVTFGGVFRVFVYGLTIRTAGSVNDGIFLTGADGAHYEWESCYFWNGNSNTGSRITINAGTSADSSQYSKLTNCTFRFGSTSQLMTLSRNVDIIGGSIASAGSTPSVLCIANTVGGVFNFHGVDLSLITGTLVAAPTTGSPIDFHFVQCKLGAAVTVLQAGGTATKGARIWVRDSNSGDTHISLGYYDLLGSLVSDTGVYFTSGAAAQSWKIDTTANASYRTPFVTPWIAFYNSATSAVTPYLEILRDGSTTAYNDDEVWGEFSAKITASSTLATVQNDRKVPGASAAAQANGAGLGSWTGEGGTAWSGKVDSGSSMTPAEVGDIAGRICVGAASATVYIDPQVRT